MKMPVTTTKMQQTRIIHDYAEEYYDCDGVCLTDTDGDGVCDEFEVLVVKMKMHVTMMLQQQILETVFMLMITVRYVIWSRVITR